MTGVRENTIHVTGAGCCPDCAEAMKKGVGSVKGVLDARFDPLRSTLTVRHTGDLRPVLSYLDASGYRASPPRGGRPGHNACIGTVVPTAIAGLCLAIALIGRFAGIPLNAHVALSLGAITAGGYGAARKALASVRQRALDMHVLLMAALAGALFLGKWLEAGALVFLFSLGSALEDYSMDRVRRSIEELMELTPDNVTLSKDGNEVEVRVEDIELGDLLIVRPGMRVALDGVVVTGASSVNQSAITGESTPVLKEASDEVLAGSINGEGYLEVRVTRPHSDTTLARIVHLVQEAQGKKASIQSTVDRFARYYTPTVIAGAILISIVPPLAASQPLSPWLYRGLTLLLVSCPCALVISTPVSIVSALSSAARSGILVKGGRHLEVLTSVSRVAFDKTGTLTEGNPEVREVIPLDGQTSEELLALAASMESRSEHPLAKAVVSRARELGLPYSKPVDFRAFPGRGVRATVDGRLSYLGTPRWFSERGTDMSTALDAIESLESEGDTVTCVGTEGRLTGLISFRDPLRPGAKQAIQALTMSGIEVSMLTGDNPQVARRVAEALGIREFHAALLPQHKASILEDMKRSGGVALVGDGINDAPALATASVGIAMGGTGSGIALETADVVLLGDGLHRLPHLFELARRAKKTIKQNILLSILVKAVAILLVFPGWLTLVIAILADDGAALLVILNALRLLGFKATPGEHA